jgi:hypothetical protein
MRTALWLCIGALTLSGCASDPTAKPVTKIDISAEALSAAFADNPSAALQRYQGAQLRVSATIALIMADSLVLSGGSDDPITVRLSDPAELSGLHQGQRIDLSCQCLSAFGNAPELADCKLER